MKIKITPAFTKADVQKDVDQFMDRVFRVTLSEISAVGLQFVSDARDKLPDEAWNEDAKDIVTASKLSGGTFSLAGGGSFNDQTGNLRSSIGYIVVYDGKIVKEDFNHGGGPIGKAEGKQFAEYQAALNPKGWALITVAGMEYAAFVEAKGYDVITGSTLNANSQMDKVWDNVRRAFAG